MTRTDSAEAPMHDPGIADGESTTYRVDIGRRQGASWIAHTISATDDEYVTTTHADFGNDVATTIEQRFRRAHAGIRAEHYLATTTNGSTIVSREEAHFIDTRHLQFGGRVAPFADQLVPLLGGLTLFRGLDFRKGHTRTIELWLGFSISWPVELRVVKKESVEVNGSTAEVWTMRLRPSFSRINSLLDKIVARILPEFLLQFDAARPHRLLTMSFPTGPFPWNPRGRLEMADIATQP
ncbi:hypothetical protein NOU13_24465 [Rhodococcus erythropolis]|uniref:hypothetical protein n=1 Tax=Rhodococcus erythropolis TaxID=1833 RepID=UPI00210D8AA7|nr:hypothetical protein [Rhodococcus erythropolis]MCQ4127658.1 hypothetical protein [Rhodococcus erythropolis]